MSKTEVTTTTDPDVRGAKLAWLLPLLSVLWLLGKLWASRGQIQATAGGTVGLATAADALPGVVEATVVAGAGLALLAGSDRIRAGLKWPARLLAGLVAGLLAAVLVHAAYPHLPAITSIEVTLVVAGLIGAALTGIPRIGLAVAAGIAAMLVALVVTTFLNSNAVLSHMLTWFGAGSSAQSVVDASKLVQYADYALIGVVAGITAFLYLRRVGATWFPLFLVGGATSGVLMLLGYLLTRIGGAHLLDAASALSEADKIANDLEQAETVPNALIVLFVGAFVALIAFGRTLKPGGQTAGKPTGPASRQSSS